MYPSQSPPVPRYASSERFGEGGFGSRHYGDLDVKAAALEDRGAGSSTYLRFTRLAN